MMVLSLCRQFCPDKIPIVPGDRLGDGADGEVFTVPNNPNQVIKFGVLFQYPLFNHQQIYDNIYSTLNKLSTNILPTYARVYEYGFLGSYERKHETLGTQKFILYYYFMEKLNKISEDESKVFHSILSHEDGNIFKDYPLSKIKKMLRGLCCGLDFDEKKVIFFCENLRLAPVEHLDVHQRNIMKDANGNFKMIDFDRCLLHGDLT